MKKPRFPRLAALAVLLFEQPISTAYLLLSVILIGLGSLIVYGDNPATQIARHLVMMATMFGIARLFNPKPLRWAWVSIVGVIGSVVVLDVVALL